MVVFLILSIPQIQNNLSRQINPSLRTDKKIDIPEAFIVDIQDYLIEDLKKYIDSNYNSGVDEKQIAFDIQTAIFRLKFVEINGKPFEMESDEPRKKELIKRFRNGHVNVSYYIPENDQFVIEGEKFYSKENQAEPELKEDTKSSVVPLSLEKDFAKILELNVGDVLTFNVMGIPRDFLVKNIRTEDWGDFGPNFYLLIDKNYLPDVPRTYFLGLNFYQEFLENREKQDQFFSEMNYRFPSVLLIQLEDFIQTFNELMEQINTAIQFLAWFSIIVGLIVIYTIISNDLSMRTAEINMLKILGAKQSQNIGLIMGEYFLLFISSISLSFLFSIAISWGISVFVFDGAFYYNWSMIAYYFCVITCLYFFSVFWGSISSLRQQENEILKSES